jgi:hypothetical protein
MFKLITPPMMVAIESRTDVILTEKPAWEKSVQNIMPRDSPQLMMQKQLYVQIRNILPDLSRSQITAVNTPKMKDEKSSNGTSRVVYCKRNVSVE